MSQPPAVRVLPHRGAASADLYPLLCLLMNLRRTLSSTAFKLALCLWHAPHFKALSALTQATSISSADKNQGEAMMFQCKRKMSSHAHVSIGSKARCFDPNGA